MKFEQVTRRLVWNAKNPFWSLKRAQNWVRKFDKNSTRINFWFLMRDIVGEESSLSCQDEDWINIDHACDWFVNFSLPLDIIYHEEVKKASQLKATVSRASLWEMKTTILEEKIPDASGNFQFTGAKKNQLHYFQRFARVLYLPTTSDVST